MRITAQLAGLAAVIALALATLAGRGFGDVETARTILCFAVGSGALAALLIHVDRSQSRPKERA